MNASLTQTLQFFFVFTLVIGCNNSKEKGNDQFLYNVEALEELRIKNRSDTTILEHERLFEIQNKYGNMFDSIDTSIDDYLIFVNVDQLKLTDRYLKKNKIWGGIQYPTLKDLMQIYDTVRIESRNYFIVEGDILLSYDAIFPYHLGRRTYTTDTSKLQGEKLVGEIRGGQYVKQKDPRGLKYSIIKKTFTQEEYDFVSNAMKQAVNDWKLVCNVDMKHLKQLDESLTINSNPDELTFVIKKVDVLGDFIANSFFPYSPKYERKLLIDQSFFKTDFSKVGILRHEIGHILGFLHEHIHSKALPICPGEPRGRATDLTKYDPKSVMHYFCGKVGTKTLLITEKDGIGASIYYPF